MGATYSYFIAFIAGQGDVVSQADALKNGPKLMKTIRPFRSDIENKI
jgi:hypothetical protein